MSSPDISEGKMEPTECHRTFPGSNGTDQYASQTNVLDLEVRPARETETDGKDSSCDKANVGHRLAASDGAPVQIQADMERLLENSNIVLDELQNTTPFGIGVIVGSSVSEEVTTGIVGGSVSEEVTTGIVGGTVSEEITTGIVGGTVSEAITDGTVCSTISEVVTGTQTVIEIKEYSSERWEESEQDSCTAGSSVIDTSSLLDRGRGRQGPLESRGQCIAGKREQQAEDISAHNNVTMSGNEVQSESRQRNICSVACSDNDNDIKRTVMASGHSEAIRKETGHSGAIRKETGHSEAIRKEAKLLSPHSSPPRNFESETNADILDNDAWSGIINLDAKQPLPMEKHIISVPASDSPILGDNLEETYAINEEAEQKLELVSEELSNISSKCEGDNVNLRKQPTLSDPGTPEEEATGVCGPSNPEEEATGVCGPSNPEEEATGVCGPSNPEEEATCVSGPSNPEEEATGVSGPSNPEEEATGVCGPSNPEEEATGVSGPSNPEEEATGVCGPSNLEEEATCVSGPSNPEEEATGVCGPSNPEEEATGVSGPSNPEEEATGVSGPSNPEEEATGVSGPSNPEEEATCVSGPSNPEEEATGVSGPSNPEEEATGVCGPSNLEEEATGVCDTSNPEEEATDVSGPSNPEEEATGVCGSSNPEEEATGVCGPSNPEEDVVDTRISTDACNDIEEPTKLVRFVDTCEVKPDIPKGVPGSANEAVETESSVTGHPPFNDTCDKSEDLTDVECSGSTAGQLTSNDTCDKSEDLTDVECSGSSTGQLTSNDTCDKSEDLTDVECSGSSSGQLTSNDTCDKSEDPTNVECSGNIYAYQQQHPTEVLQSSDRCEPQPQAAGMSISSDKCHLQEDVDSAIKDKEHGFKASKMCTSRQALSIKSLPQVNRLLKRVECSPNKANETQGEKVTSSTILQYKLGQFQCSSCDFSTSLAEAFRVHLLCHNFGALYKCMFCATLTQEITQIRRHLELSHCKQPVTYGRMAQPFIDRIMDTLSSSSETTCIKSPKGQTHPSSTEVSEGQIAVSGNENVIGGVKQTNTMSDAVDKRKGSAESSHSPIVIDDNEDEEVECARKNDIVKTTKLECSFSQGKFRCVTCAFDTLLQSVMESHLYQHLHLVIPGARPLCVRCRPHPAPENPAACPVVQNMVFLLLKQKENFIKEGLKTPPCKTSPVLTHSQLKGKQMTLVSDLTASHSSPRPVLMVGPVLGQESQSQLDMPHSHVSPAVSPAAASTPHKGQTYGSGKDMKAADEQKESTDHQDSEAEDGVLVVDETVPREKPKHIADQRRRSSQSSNASTKSQRRKVILAASITYEKHNYVCKKCKFKTKLPLQFRRHLWKDIHPKNQCNHCSPEILYNRLIHCRLLDALLGFAYQIKNEDPEIQEMFLSGDQWAQEEEISEGVQGRLLEVRILADDSLTVLPVYHTSNRVREDLAHWTVTPDGHASHVRHAENITDPDCLELGKFPTHTRLKRMVSGSSPNLHDESKADRSNPREVAESLDLSDAPEQSGVDGIKSSGVSGALNSGKVEGTASNNNEDLDTNPDTSLEEIDREMESKLQPGNNTDDNASSVSSVLDCVGPVEEDDGSLEAENDVAEGASRMLPGASVNDSSTTEVRAELPPKPGLSALIQRLTEKKQEESQLTGIIGEKSPNSDGDQDSTDLPMVVVVDEEADPTNICSDDTDKKPGEDQDVPEDKVTRPSEGKSNGDDDDVSCVGFSGERHPPNLQIVAVMNTLDNTQPLFQCAYDQCNGWNSDSQVSFKLHCMGRHYRESPQICYLCSQSCLDEDQLIEHIKKAHGPVLPFKCHVDTCQFATSIMHDLRTHLSVCHKAELTVCCSYCKTKYSTHEELLQHLATNVLQLHKCPICEMSVPQIATIREHVLSMHPGCKERFIQEVYVVCRKTPHKTTASQSVFAVERLVGGGLIATENLECASHLESDQARKPSILRGTSKTSTQPKQSPNFVCSCLFFSRSLLAFLWHIKTCDLNQQLASTEGGSVYTAQTKNTVTTTPGSAEMSENSNDGLVSEAGGPLIPPIVIVPERKKQRKQVLESVPLLEETPYERLKPCKETQCGVCSFKTSFQLLSQAHGRLHSNKELPKAKEYTCTVCPFTTDQLGFLKSHLCCHAGQRCLKLFHCGLCPKVVTSMELIEEHLMDCHPDDDFHFEGKLQKLQLLCPACDLAFKSETALLDHLQKKHVGELEKYVQALYGIAVPPSSSESSLSCFLDESGGESDDCIMEKDEDYKPTSKKKAKRKSTRKSRHSSEGNLGQAEPESGQSPSLIKGPRASTSSRQSVTDGQMQCTYCDFTCDDIQSWKNHYGTHTNIGLQHIKVYFCRTCDWPSNLKKLVLEHCQSEHVMSLEQAKQNGYEAQKLQVGNETIQQSESSQSSQENTQPTAPNAISMSIYRYHCDMCEFSTNDIQKYNAHMVTHDDDSSTYVPTAALSDDSQDEIGSSDEQPKKRVVGSMADIMQARQVNRGSFRFKCKDCPYATNTSKHYNAHVATHLKQALIQDGFKCAYCSMVAVVAGNVTRHLRVYHPNQPLEMVPIRDGIPQETTVAYPDLQPTKQEASHTASNKKVRASARLQAELRKSSQEVRSLPPSLAQTLDESGISIPDESIFKEPLKCPSCDYSTKVRMSYIRHWRQHLEGASTKPQLTQPRSPMGPASTFLTQLGFHAESPPNNSPGPQNDDDTILNDEDVSEEDEDEEEEDEAEERSKFKVTPEISRYCKKVEDKDLYQCLNCVFMNKYPSKVLRHFRFKHETARPYRCGYCDFDSDESPAVRSHCQLEHEDLPVKMVDVTFGKVYQGEEAMESIIPTDMTTTQTVPPDEIDALVARYISRNGGSMHTCRICNYKQKYFATVKRHLCAVHLNYHPYRCKYCLFAAVERNKTILHLRNSHPDMRVKIVRQKFQGILPVLGQEKDQWVTLDDSAAHNADNNVEDSDNNVSHCSTPLNIPNLNNQLSSSPVPMMELRIENVGSITQDTDTMLATTAEKDPQTYRFTADGNIVPVDTQRQTESLSAVTEDSLTTIETTESSPVLVSGGQLVTLTDGQVMVKNEPSYDSSSYGVMPEGSSVHDDSPRSSPIPTPASQVKVEPDLQEEYASATSSPSTSSPVKGTTRSTPTKEGAKLKRCKYCSYQTQWNIADVKTHILVTHLGKYPYGCKFCGYTGRDKKRLREHSTKAHPNKPSGFRYLFNDYSDVIYTERQGSTVIIGITTIDKKSGPVPVYTKKPLPKAKKNEQQDGPLDLSVPKLDMGPTLGTLYSTSISTGPLSLKIKLGKEAVAEESSSESPPPPPPLTPAPSETPSPSGRNLGGPTKHLQCKMCGYTHFDLYKIKTHILLKHCMLKPYACVYCDFEELTYHKAVRHVKETHSDLPFRIRKILNEKDSVLRKKIQKTDLSIARQQHQQQQQGKTQQPLPQKFRPFACRQCNYRAFAKAKIKYHSARMHPGKPVQWMRLEEGQGSSQEVTLAEGTFYAGEESGEMPVKKNTPITTGPRCTKCDISFQTESSLHRHLAMVHTGPKSPAPPGFFHCVYCPSVVKYKNKAKFHMRAKHPDQPIIFNWVKDSAGPPCRLNYRKKVKPPALPKTVVPSPVCVKREMPEEVAEVRFTEAPATKKPRLAVPEWKVKLQSGITEDLYRCRACKFATRDQFVMRNHVQAHISYLPYCCPYCTYANVKSFPVKIHVAKLHPTEVVRFVLRRDDAKEEQLKQLYSRPAYLRKTPTSTKKTVAQVKHVLDNIRQQHTPIDPAHEPAATGSKAKKVTPFSTYKCTLCGAITKNHTGIKRHLMWELRYLPYMCPCCPFKCAHRFGAEKHCRSKHGVENPEIILGHNPEREAHIAKLIRESRIPNQKRPTFEKKVVLPPPLPIKQEIMNSAEDVITSPMPSLIRGPSKPLVASHIAKKYIKRLQSHALKRRPRTGKMKRCNLCGFTSSIFKTMQNHVVRHGPKRYLCTYCDYGAFYRYEVIKHCFKFHPESPANHKILDVPRLNVSECTREVEADGEEASLLLPTANGYDVTGEAKGLSSPLSQASAALRLKTGKPGMMVIDGMEICPSEIYRDPHGEHYLCRHCTYFSTSKDHWKYHLVKHILPRWQCSYCKMQGQLSYDLRKHIRSKHPQRSVKMFKIDPLSENNRTYGGKLIILNGGPRWRDIETDVWYGGAEHTQSGMSVRVKQEVTDTMETGLSSYSPGTLAFNCYYCTYKTTDPVVYAEHIRAHTARRGEEDSECASTAASQLSWSVDADVVPHLGQATVILFDIMKLPCDDLAKVMAENGIHSVQ